MLLRLRQDFVIWKLVRKQGINIHAALRRFRENFMFKPIRSVLETMVKLAPFCISACSLPNGSFLLIWTIT